ncbi:MAG: hypothetical protein QOH35_2768 [Acidobacteriaceae bacterium]|jgi:hypothetical protein|nr:hypothetical protein [Acidobacteriaceae bacterium]
MRCIGRLTEKELRYGEIRSRPRPEHGVISAHQRGLNGAIKYADRKATQRLPTPRGTLVYPLMGEAVAACPKGALGTRLTVGIVHAFFMRTADDAVDCGHGTDFMLTEKGVDLLCDGVVVADVTVLGKPALEVIGLSSFVGNYRHGDLGS